MSEPGNDHYFQGPVDVDNVQALPNIACNSYKCGSVEEMTAIVGNTAAAFTSSNDGHWGVIGRQ